MNARLSMRLTGRFFVQSSLVACTQVAWEVCYRRTEQHRRLRASQEVFDIEGVRGATHQLHFHTQLVHLLREHPLMDNMEHIRESTAEASIDKES